ncbi:protein of unknown function [Methylotuvimicrobium alcaliphilum 20Z]|uniref:Uncharacterized protein n=1 Tax=Methylotuvimicrobium alcaliphilum (strain DSM 19304 / NCIMB 14124 / VKM B-2133 / 20Z) TaxID=1091494 RepID=G4T3X7_META2|nr:protein of unknown function [Methylotuvimicrobium alcaliphilum 20Z]
MRIFKLGVDSFSINKELVILFAIQISAVPEEASGCAAPHLTLGEGPAWNWHRAYMDVFTQHLNSIAHWLWLTILDNLGAGFTASFDGHPGAESGQTH